MASGASCRSNQSGRDAAGSLMLALHAADARGRTQRLDTRQAQAYRAGAAPRREREWAAFVVPTWNLEAAVLGA